MSNAYDQIIDKLLMLADTDESPVVSFVTKGNFHTVRNGLRVKYKKLVKDYEAMGMPVAYNHITISHAATSDGTKFTVSLKNKGSGADFDFEIVPIESTTSAGDTNE